VFFIQVNRFAINLRFLSIETGLDGDSLFSSLNSQFSGLSGTLLASFSHRKTLIMKRFLFTLFLLAAVVVAGIYLIKKAAPSTRSDGVGIGSSTHLRVGVDGLPGAMDLITGMGATWIREEFPWNAIQQIPDEFRWSDGNGTITRNFDTLIAEARQNKIKILAVLDGGPVFLAHVYPGMPVDKQELLTAWQGYVQAVVDRYGDQVIAWEIGNRENTAAGWGKVMFPTAADALANPDPELYSQMLQVAYKIIKAKNSNAQVILGGLEMKVSDCSENPFAFLAAVEKSGGWQSFDSIGLQLIGSTTWPEQPSLSENEHDLLTGACVPGTKTWRTILDEIQSVVTFSRQFGEKNIWVTAVGYNNQVIQDLAPYDPNTASLVESDLLTRTLVPILADPSVKKVFWYTLADDPTNPGFSMGPFGQITMANINAFLKTSKPLGTILQDGIPVDVDVYAFDKDGKTIFVIWRAVSGTESEPVTISGLQGNSAIAYAADAAEISDATAQPLVVNADGNITLMVSRRPLFIVAQANDLAGRLQSSAQDQVDQVKESVDSGAKTLWEGAKTSVSNQISSWLNDIKNSILQSIQQKLDQVFK
jgi:hypothetical protein